MVFTKLSLLTSGSLVIVLCAVTSLFTISHCQIIMDDQPDQETAEAPNTVFSPLKPREELPEAVCHPKDACRYVYSDNGRYREVPSWCVCPHDQVCKYHSDNLNIHVYKCRTAENHHFRKLRDLVFS